jgi:DNA-binding transcriptional MerR regulator
VISRCPGEAEAHPRRCASNEERGLITSERAGSGHRRFPRAVLRKIAFIVLAQRIGLTLEEISAELAKLPTDRIPTRRMPRVDDQPVTRGKPFL